MDYLVSMILAAFGFGGSSIKEEQTTSSAFFHS
jgi:hypothetical protein